MSRFRVPSVTFPRVRQKGQAHVVPQASRFRFLTGPRSLRGRLILGAALLAVISVAGAQSIGLHVLRTWLLAQVDQQLNGFPTPRGAPLPAPPGFTGGVLPSDFRVIVFDDAGVRQGIIGSGRRPGPLVPDPVGSLATGPVTLDAVSGDGHWRVRKATASDGTTFLVCLPLDTYDGATRKLLLLDLIVLAGTALALVALSRWVVRIGLLPLTRMENTARDITATTLGGRIENTDRDTEIGRLGAVLNTMLERLEAALREQEASERRLRQFVADAGHELRTPLTTIHGFAQLALRGGFPGDGRAEADQLIALNAERMRLLVDDMLLLAELDREPTYAREVLDLRATVTEAVRTASLHRDPSLIRLDAAASPVSVVGDPHRLRQVVANLVTNALVHTPPVSQISVHVGYSRFVPSDAFSAQPLLERDIPVAVIEVRDEGPGMSESDASRIFERFYRADPSRSTPGSGLGLAIASAIVRGHEGRLELELPPSGGCLFRVILPAQ